MQNYFSIKLNQLFTIVGLFLISTVSSAEPASAESIRVYFQVSGQEAAAKEIVANILPILKNTTGNIPEDLLNELYRTDNMVDRIIPIYQKYFTEQELKELIAFYKTPTGLKFAKNYGKMQEEVIRRSMSDMQMTIINYYAKRQN